MARGALRAIVVVPPTVEKPHDLPYPPIKGPLPCEADIKDWLDWNVTADDLSKAYERVRRLAMIFRPLVSPYREALKARLRADSTKDGLAHLFHTRLSTGSRQLLISLQKFHSDYERIYPPPGAGSRSGDFDQVWRRYKMVDGEKQFLDEVYIIEAKGGAGKLGVRMVDGKVVEQGTTEYYQAIRENMKSIDKATYNALIASKKNTRYILVHSPIVSGDPSVANTILTDEFKIGMK